MATKIENKNFARVLPCFYLKKNYPVARKFFSIYLFNASWLIEGHHVLLMAMKMQNRNFARVLPSFYLNISPRGYENFLNLLFFGLCSSPNAGKCWSRGQIFKIKILREFCLLFTWIYHPEGTKIFSIYFFFGLCSSSKAGKCWSWQQKSKIKSIAGVLPCFYLKKKLSRSSEIFLNLPF